MLPKSNIRKLFRHFDRGSDRAKYIRLDKNERTFALNSKYIKNILKKNYLDDLVTQYPDQNKLYEILSNKLKISKNQILLTPGSDAGIKYFFETYVKKNDKVGILNPTYQMINVYCKMYSAKVIQINYNYDLSLKNQIAKVIDKVDHLIIANPNQPTGTYIGPNELVKILKTTKKKNVSLFIDEAYIEFVKSLSVKWQNYISKYTNVFIQRTFSKFFGLAGLRLGYILSSEENIFNINKVKPLSDINLFSILLAIEILKDKKYSLYKKELLKSFKYFSERIKKIKEVKIIKSHTNFFHIKFNSKNQAKKFLDLAKKNSILCRETNYLQETILKNSVRVSIGNKNQMKILSNLIFKTFDEKNN